MSYQVEYEALVDNPLRIPMRGYEHAAIWHDGLIWDVTNPHAGL